MFNNGSNVVNPANKLAEVRDPKKTDDATTERLEAGQAEAILKTIKRGHMLDFVGFTIMWLLVVGGGFF